MFQIIKQIFSHLRADFVRVYPQEQQVLDARLRADLYPHYCRLMALAWRMGGWNKT